MFGRDRRGAGLCGGDGNASRESAQSLLRLPMDDGLRARAMELVDGLKDASGRVMFELALLQTEVGGGKADAARVVARLIGMDTLMMGALTTLTDVADKLEKDAERDEQHEPAYVLVIEAVGVLLQGLEKAKSATQALARRCRERGRRHRGGSRHPRCVWRPMGAR